MQSAFLVVGNNMLCTIVEKHLAQLLEKLWKHIPVRFGPACVLLGVGGQVWNHNYAGKVEQK